uniref:Interleukin 3 n=1 Tax=Meleagris gallopavo TaxID=9103 RepID=G1N9D5_MELGA
MLLLLCLLLSCWAPSCPSPLPLVKGCPISSLWKEVIQDVQGLQGSNETVPPNNIILMMEKQEENAVVYLEEFIKALESSRKKQLQLIHKLRSIFAARETCTGWLKHKWEPMENYGFFKNLEELLKFLNMYGFSEETT